MHLVRLRQRRTTWPSGVPYDAIFASSERLERALLTTFLLDPSWLFDARRSPASVAALRGADEVVLCHQQAGLPESGPLAGERNVRLHTPRVRLAFGDSMHHAKAALLFFGTHVRVVVSTANLTGMSLCLRAFLYCALFCSFLLVLGKFAFSFVV